MVSEVQQLLVLVNGEVMFSLSDCFEARIELGIFLVNVMLCLLVDLFCCSLYPELA